MLHEVSSHVLTTWLFVASDARTMVVPNLIFAFVRATKTHNMGGLHFARRLLRISAWLLLHLLAFALGNQSKPSAIKEDQQNKPWRPIPSGRITARSAERLGTLVTLISMAFSCFMNGGQLESGVLAILGYAYNRLDFGDRHWLLRNTTNAVAFAAFASGSVSVATQSIVLLGNVGDLSSIAGVVLTTVHAQDLYDQEGDLAANRSTVPFHFGEGPARLSILLGIAFWTTILYLRDASNMYGIAVVGAIGMMVGTRTICRRTVAADKFSLQLYCVWLASIYLLPMLKRE